MSARLTACGLGVHSWRIDRYSTHQGGRLHFVTVLVCERCGARVRE